MVDETIDCIGVIKHLRKGEMTKPTPHGPKLKELSSNSKLPAEDQKAVASAIGLSKPSSEFNDHCII